MELERTGMTVLSGNSHPDLARLISDRLNTPLADCSVYNKPNQETNVEIGQSLREKDVFIIQTGTKDVNQNIMELLIMIYACKTSVARSITVVMPYLPYSKQCRMRKRSAITCKLIANMISRAGAHKLITMDLYRKEIQGFFDIPVDNLRASPFLLQYIKEQIPDYRNAIIVAKNLGVMNKATSYSERLRLGIAVVHGEEQKESDPEMLDGRCSPPILHRAETGSVASAASSLEYMPVLCAKEKPPLTLVGDVGGKIAIMVDDIIDDVESFVAAAHLLKERGAYKIYVIATHGLLNSDAPRLLEDSPVDEIVVTNTVPHDVQKMQCHKIKTVDASLMFSEAIRRTYHRESMSHLFKDVTLDD